MAFAGRSQFWMYRLNCNVPGHWRLKAMGPMHRMYLLHSRSGMYAKSVRSTDKHGFKMVLLTCAKVGNSNANKAAIKRRATVLIICIYSMNNKKVKKIIIENLYLPFILQLVFLVNLK